MSDRPIAEHGYHDGVGAFTQAFGSDVLDASALRIPLVGFLPRNDDRVRSTVAAIDHTLTDDRGFDAPQFESVDAVDWLEDDEAVLSLSTASHVRIPSAS